MGSSVNEWTFCTEHRKAVDGGSCDECVGDRNLVQVVRRYYLDVARNQLAELGGPPTLCTCAAIQAADATRHFRECPRRALHPKFAGSAPVSGPQCPWCDRPIPESAPDGHRCECGAVLTNTAP
jgi:hypothetical protein